MKIIIILFIVVILWFLFSVFCALVNVTPEEKSQDDEAQIEFLKKLRDKNLINNKNRKSREERR